MTIAQFDIFHGEQLTGIIYTFNVTAPLSGHFEENNFDSMNYMVNIGSVIIPILASMIVIFIISKILHTLAIIFYEYSYCRKIGMAVES